ncbi:MAG: hypothetical protein WB664_09875, partial [Nitrososphaeraceae archaeon]
NISIIWKLKAARADREIKILISRCDLCKNHITGAPDDLESQINMSKDTDDNPRLLLVYYYYYYYYYWNLIFKVIMI